MNGQRHHQRGVALVVGLLLLLVLTLMGISTFSNSHIQERSASNARLQAMAFEAAAAGASNAIDFFVNNRDSSGYTPDAACGDAGHDGWEAATDWVNMGGVGGANLQQRLYCLADLYPGDTENRPARSELFVLSRGEVYAPGEGVGDIPMAVREVEVRLDIGQPGTPGVGCGAICFPGCEFDTGSSQFPNSNSFQVDGNGMPAITGGCDQAAEDIRSEIRDNRIGNYIGGIGVGGSEAPFDAPSNTDQFRADIKQAAIFLQNAGCSNCYHSGSLSTSGNTTFGTNENPQITYVEGDLSIGGSISGAGIFLVKGNISWNGTINFRGLIATLGGSFQISGGGRGGNPGDFDPDKGGTVVVLNTYDGGELRSDEDGYGEASWNNNGGGTAYYRFDCDAVNEAADNLVNTLALAGLTPSDQGVWRPGCEANPGLWILGPEELVIASWRENLGWRETFFGSVEAEEEE